MKYKVISAFFCQGFNPQDTEPAKRAKMLGVLYATTATGQVQVLVDIEGPPGASDFATLKVRLANGKAANVGPERFHFDPNGRAALVFFLNVMPLTAIGPVTAELLFSGETTGSSVCSMAIVPPPLPGGSISH